MSLEATVNLEKREEQAWRALLRAQSELVTTIDKEMTAAHDLGLADFDVLKHLSEADEQGQRMTELARGVLLSPSGLTRRLDGLVKAGYVERRPSPDDGRGLLAVLTDEGKRKLREMAPTHARAVRRHFSGRLDQNELSRLIEVFEILASPAIAETIDLSATVTDIRDSQTVKPSVGS